MIMMIEDHHHRSNHKIKEYHEAMGQGSWIKGALAKTLKKGGVRGGPKNRQILHTGGENPGGGFLGGVPKNRDHKTWSFMMALNLKVNHVVEDNHHR